VEPPPLSMLLAFVRWRYVHRRLLEISSERQNAGGLQQRQKSFSLPAAEFPTSAPLAAAAAGFAPAASPSDADAGAGWDGACRGQPAFKRQRAAEPPEFAAAAGDDDRHRQRQRQRREKSRSDSALSRLTENDEDSSAPDDDDFDDSSSEAAAAAAAGRQFRCTVDVVHGGGLDDDDDSSVGSGQYLLRKPIITITADTPAASPASRSPVLQARAAAADRRESKHHYQVGSPRSIELLALSHIHTHHLGM